MSINETGIEVKTLSQRTNLKRKKKERRKNIPDVKNHINGKF